MVVYFLPERAGEFIHTAAVTFLTYLNNHIRVGPVEFIANERFYLFIYLFIYCGLGHDRWL